MNWLSPDSRFMQAWGNFTDGILINLFMILTSIPLITIGASLAAGNVAARKTLYGEGRGVTKTYFSAFSQNWKKATILWLPYLFMGAVLGYLWLFIRISELLIVEIGLTVVWIIGFEWTFAVQARFENTVLHTWFNSFIFSMKNVGMTIALIGIDIVFIAIFLGTYYLMPPLLFLVVVCGYGSVLMLHVPLTERCLKKYFNLKTDE